MRTDATFLGLIGGVEGARARVRITADLPSASPIVHGRLYRLGQVGSFVRIPLGFLNVFGIVSKVGASETPEPAGSHQTLDVGQRWIEVELVGEAYRGARFERGVSSFPTLDDEVHIVTEDDLRLIYGTAGPASVEIGWHSASDNLRARVDLDKIVTRHAAIIGSTGSGKSNAVAGFLKALSGGAFPGAHVVVIDPHGEYRTALRDQARVFRIDDSESPLVVPYWALSFDELAWFLIGRSTASESLQDSALREQIFEQKRCRCTTLAAGSVPAEQITVDSPVPFSIRDVWYHFDRMERATFREVAKVNEALIEEGDAASLKSAKFQPHGPGNTSPFKGVSLGMGPYVNKILGRLKDRRFDFLLSPDPYDGANRDLHDLLRGWVDHDRPITVLDLGGVPSEVVDLVVGVVARVLFEGMFWGRDLAGTGRQRPLLIIFEEAHSYLPRGGSPQFAAGYASVAVRRIFREGRKYGIGGIVISQRPSELDETILAQCGTFVALRLSNSDDQGRVKAAVPDTLAGLMELLPALRTGEAVVLGEAVPIPSRIRLPLIEPRPKSDDPEVASCWGMDREGPAPYAEAVTGWRQQRMAVSSAATESEERSDAENAGSVQQS
ncbi:MAG: DUF87 domain-containing protein [Actinomycetota bacterium]